MKRCRVPSALAILTFGLAVPALAQQADSGLSLIPLFTDGVVLQRQATLPVWGHAAPGARVTVSFRGTTRTATADAAGAWRVQLPPQQAGGPFELAVQAGSGQVTLHDVLVGDVWVASGQSNMEFNLFQSRNGRADAAAAHDSLLRHFYVPNAWAPAPQSELKGGPWNPADSAHAGRFTAVGYYFARDLRSALKIPIGIIHTSWGGANIETWISGAGQGIAPGVLDSIATAERTLGDRVRANLKEKLGYVPTVDSGLVAGKAVWADPGLDDAAWPNLRVPGAWESAGYPGLDGVAWYRTSFDLTDADLGKPVKLVLGSIDDADVTWVNGTEVGRTGQVFLPRNYTVPASALHAGRNVLAVRVTDFGGEGGIMGRPNAFYLDVGGEQRPFAPEWKFRVAMVQTGTDGQRINKIPTFLYNAMVHPLLPDPIKGVIWYQGESNANNDQQARAYAALMKDIVASWRQEWTGEPKSLQPFPFLWVQLP
ncbi:MAG TPA: sialate O-acetylesterase, partial [Longimicrobiales bacterium]